MLDHIAAWAFQLTGGENLWIPRLISSLFWVIGGIFLYLIAQRLTTQAGALVALALYLFWPYGVLISRLYMPDAPMVALLLGGALAVIRYYERPSSSRLAAASAVAALATLAKPGIALIFLLTLFCVLALEQRAFTSTLRRGSLPLYLAVAAAPTVAYYLYGTYIHNFLTAEADAGARVQPHLLATAWFWRGWWEMISIVLPFPQTQHDLALIPLAAGVAGLVVAPSRSARAILTGLFVGYLVYAFALTAYTPSHAYYALPLIPILALSTGTAVGSMLARLGSERPSALAALASLLLLILIVGTYKSRPAAPDRTAIADYERIGEITRHTTHAIIVDERLRSPAMYWGWLVGHYWYPPTPAQDLPASGNPFPPWIDPATVKYLVIVGLQELRTERRLRAFTDGLPVVAETSRYAVFDLRGGRALAAAHVDR